MRKLIYGVIFLALPAYADAACPNQSSTVTIPISGAATLSMVDSVSCSPVPGNGFTGQLPSGFPLNATSVPAASYSTSGIALSANGAVFGSTYALIFTYSNGRTVAVLATVGGAVTPAATTTTP